MRRDSDFFGGQPLSLLYIGRRLREALAAEKLLEEAGVDYMVEVDYYVGGLVFRSQRAGAFIYVPLPSRAQAAALLASSGLRPQDPELGQS